MKKFIAVTMIALLAVTSVFAGFSGSAQAGLTADFTGEKYGFTGPAGSFSLSFDANTLNGASKGEGTVYAEVGATAEIAADKDWDKVAGADKEALGMQVSISLDKLAIVGDNWDIDLINVLNAADLAKDWYKFNNKNADIDFALAPVPGVTVTVDGYKVGVGFQKNTEGTAALLSASTKKFDFNGLTVEAGIGAAKDYTASNIGLDVSAKLGYAADKLAVSAASDFVLDIPTADGAKLDFKTDVAAAVSYDFVSLNAYYATKAVNGFAGSGAENYYTVGLGFDFASLFAPLTLNINALNIKKDTGVVEADAAFAFEGGNVAVNGNYDFASTKWAFGADADYTIANVGKIAAGFGLEDSAKVLKVNASIVNDTLIDNAELSLGYASGNLLADKAEIGAVNALVTVTF